MARVKRNLKLAFKDIGGESDIRKLFVKIDLDGSNRPEGRVGPRA